MPIRQSSVRILAMMEGVVDKNYSEKFKSSWKGSSCPLT